MTVDDNSTKQSPSVLILTPTRELALQIEHAIHPFCSELAVSQLSVYGGVAKQTQIRALRAGVSIIIATPGRLLDLLQSNATTLERCSLVILDEADRMLSMGFEPAIQNIIRQVSQCQTLLWSATWPPEVTHFTSTLTKDPVRVTVGGAGLKANSKISQKFLTLSEAEKYSTMTELLRTEFDGSRWLCFCCSKRRCEELTKRLRLDGWPAMCVHGDKCQLEREWVMGEFRSGNNPIMLSTDLAARGLDVADIAVVINYDMPAAAEDYIHRIGRTGRGGASGAAISFLPQQWHQDKASSTNIATSLIEVISKAKQKIPVELLKLAGTIHT